MLGIGWPQYGWLPGSGDAIASLYGRTCKFMLRFVLVYGLQPERNTLRLITTRNHQIRFMSTSLILPSETSTAKEKHDQLSSVADVFESCWPEKEEVKAGWELLQQHCTLRMRGVLG